MYLIAILVGLMMTLIPLSRWSATVGYRKWLLLLFVTLVQVLIVSVALMIMPQPTFD